MSRNPPINLGLLSIFIFGILGIFIPALIYNSHKKPISIQIEACVHVRPEHRMIEYLQTDQCLPINAAFKAGRESAKILP